MRITKKFLQLTKKTYPHGTESGLVNNLPNGSIKDEWGNFYVLIGEKPNTMFTCHLDTADSKQKKVNHVFDGNMIKTDGTSILGADDKAGMTVISYMIGKGVPGLYYFFLGEEVGCVGSRKVASTWKLNPFSEHINKCVSFDRRGTGSVITYQMFGRCCSETFAKELSKRLNDTGNGLKMAPDNTGILTDSAKFMDLIPECTNISVGYYNEHTHHECQDIEFLKKLCRSVISIDWETLPIERNQNSYEDDWGSPGDDDEWDFWNGYEYGRRSSKSKTEYVSSDTNWNIDNYTHVSLDGVTKKVYLHNEQIKLEKDLIYEWLFITNDCSDLVDIAWNGHSLYSQSSSGRLEYVGSRNDLMDHIDELRSVPREYISETINLKKKESDYGFNF
mgnify:CR=1 FL=1|jgi:hypothetical protein